MKSQPIAPELVDISLAEFAEYVFRSRNLTYNSVLAYRYALKNYGPRFWPCQSVRSPIWTSSKR